ncbi:MAG: PEGA domain-containing protein [Labilithrix sp.]|nr:PEGA domain-containing protein [Labilithrix sp.]
MSRTLAAVAALLTASACGPPPPPKTISMRMVGSPASASVTIDDIFVGRLDTVAARGVALPVGTHHVSVEAPGYLPWDKVVEAKDGAGPLRLEVRLVATPE